MPLETTYREELHSKETNISSHWTTKEERKQAKAYHKAHGELHRDSGIKVDREEHPDDYKVKPTNTKKMAAGDDIQKGEDNFTARESKDTPSKGTDEAGRSERTK